MRVWPFSGLRGATQEHQGRLCSAKIRWQSGGLGLWHLWRGREQRSGEAGERPGATRTYLKAYIKQC